MASSESVIERPTFARELDALAEAHRAAWLASVLPAGPALTWSVGRAIAAALCTDGSRGVVALEPLEAVAADVMRRGSAGLRVLHAAGPRPSVPDLAGLGLTGFRSIVVAADDALELAIVLPQLVAAAEAGCTVCVIDPPDPDAAVEMLADNGLEGAVVHVQRVLAASHIAPRAQSPAPATVDGDVRDIEAERVLVTCGIAQAERDASSVRLGHPTGTTSWRTGVDQMAASLARIDRTVGDLHAARVVELEAALDVAQHRNDLAQQETAAWAERVELLRRSTSWRVTAPLRRVTDLLRRR
ncbi:MAG: hypothetical protein ACT4OV_13610 [Microthrixaceae bacterium]